MTNWTLGSLFTGQLVRMAAKQAEDTKAFARWSEDPEYLRLLFRDPAVPRSPESFEDKKDDKHHHDGRHFEFTFRTLADDKFIGFGGLNVSWANQGASLWIGIGEPDYRGKGYGSDAMRLLVNYAFRELGLYRVGLEVFGYNTRAIHVYEKLGFVYEGAQREALYREGQRYDTLSMSILRPEWEAIQQVEAAAEPEKV